MLNFVNRIDETVSLLITEPLTKTQEHTLRARRLIRYRSDIVPQNLTDHFCQKHFVFCFFPQFRRGAVLADDALCCHISFLCSKHALWGGGFVPFDLVFPYGVGVCNDNVTKFYNFLSLLLAVKRDLWEVAGQLSYYRFFCPLTFSRQNRTRSFHPRRKWGMKLFKQWKVLTSLSQLRQLSAMLNRNWNCHSLSRSFDVACTPRPFESILFGLIRP
jgi:hypothetical protein